MYCNGYFSQIQRRPNPSCLESLRAIPPSCILAELWLVSLISLNNFGPIRAAGEQGEVQEDGMHVGGEQGEEMEEDMEQEQGEQGEEKGSSRGVDG